MLQKGVWAVAVLLALLGRARATDPAHHAHHLAWEYCNEGAYHSSNITDVLVKPWPPRAGDTIHLVVKGRHANGAPRGTLHYAAAYQGFTLYHGKEDMCKRGACHPPRNGAVSAAPEDFVYRATERLPSMALPGRYDLKVPANDEHGIEIVCAKAKLKVSGHLAPLSRKPTNQPTNQPTDHQPNIPRNTGPLAD